MLSVLVGIFPHLRPFNPSKRPPDPRNTITFVNIIIIFILKSQVFLRFPLQTTLNFSLEIESEL